MPRTMRTAAIVGGGPGGLVAARWLREVGFDTTVFEQHDELGGQWHVSAPAGSIWPGMRTNTSHVMTAFSDLAHPPGSPTYVTAEAIGAYLRRYADHVGVAGDVRLGTRVVEVSPDDTGDGWRVRTREGNGAEREEHFSHVIAAPGRYRTPAVPDLTGLPGFTGTLGVSHAAAYRGAERFRGRRVLVAGHSISAVEIASEIALRGAARVLLAARRHRYVLQKILAGVPIEYRVFTRYGALAAETYSPEVTAAALKAFIVRTSGHPSQFGAPCASEDVREAGFTQNQYYLAQVAEGRIAPKPWLAGVDGDTVRFTDGSSETVDAIVCATGYKLDLPFLGPKVRAALRPDAAHLDLYHHTFHPDLPGLAFVGVYEQAGPYFPTLELQARWVAYVWGGRRAAPTRDAMDAGIAAYQARRGQPQIQRMHTLALLLAREAGVEPVLANWPALTRALLFGPLSPASFRLDGPDALPHAPRQVAEAAAAFGAVPDATLTNEEREQLRALAAARSDTDLASLCN